MTNYYEILEVNIKDDFNIIKKNYYRLAMKYHPDKNKNNKNYSETKFKEIVEAYEVLSNPVKRKKYDISLKKNDIFNFKLPENIYNFSKLFFSEENISKFNNMTSSFNNNIKNMGINIDFEILLNTFLTNIRNNKYNNLYEEFLNFKKFYDYDLNNKNEFETELKEKYFSRMNDLKKNRSAKKITKIVPKNFVKKNLKNKFININVNVDLHSIYNKVIKSVSINVNKPCKYCFGKGIIKTNKNKINECLECNGKSYNIIKKKFIIDTSVDKIYYLNEHYINEKEGYYDIIFTIIPKKHEFIKLKNRYDLEIDKEINLYEYYYGGMFQIKHLDNFTHNLNFQGFNNGQIINTITKNNMGLIFVDDIKKYNNKNIMCNKDINIERGNLYINFILKVPIYDNIKLRENEEKIKNIV